MLDRFKCGSLTAGPVDLVLGCVDNYAARISVPARTGSHAEACWEGSGLVEARALGVSTMFWR